jgi:carbamoyltransferase
MMDWMNRRLRRTEFMPFAPVALAEDADDWYERLDGARDPARFMTMAFPCTPAMRRLCPGVVHADGTARPQLVRREENPEICDIVREYRRLTGLPALVNTSFNLHEEPIVCTPADAVATFREAGLDFLSIEGRIAWVPGRSDLAEAARRCSSSA